MFGAARVKRGVDFSRQITGSCLARLGVTAVSVCSWVSVQLHELNLAVGEASSTTGIALSPAGQF